MAKIDIKHIKTKYVSKKFIYHRKFTFTGIYKAEKQNALQSILVSVYIPDGDAEGLYQMPRFFITLRLGNSKLTLATDLPKAFAFLFKDIAEWLIDVIEADHLTDILKEQQNIYKQNILKYLNSPDPDINIDIDEDFSIKFKK